MFAIERLAESETGEVGDVDSEVPGNIVDVMKPSPGTAAAATVNYYERFAFSACIVVDVKITDCYLSAVYYGVLSLTG